jgi:hypothetical protein
VVRRKNGEGTSISWKDFGEKYGILVDGETTSEDFAKKFNEIGWPENILFPLNGWTS